MPTPAAPRADEPGASNAAPPDAAATDQGPTTQATADQGPTTQAAAGQKPGDQATAGDGPTNKPSGPSRRDVLIGAGTASIAAVGAAYISWELRTEKLPAYVRSRAGRVAVVRPVVTAAPRPTRADWAALRAHLSTGRLLRPHENAYDQAKQLFEPRFDALLPAAIAYCGTAADVATCLSFVRKYRLPVRVRSGGHSYAGWSSVTGGFIIDVSPMNSVTFDGPNVTVGAGADLMHCYSRLGASGLAFPGGSYPTLGVAGLALGGGIGPLTRLLGTTSDNMAAMELVTADGSELTCNNTQNPDLFWACRGGGGGNFGVTTSLTFSTRSLTEVCVFGLSWPWAHAARVVRAWQSWAPFAPDGVSSNMQLSARFGGSPTLSVTGTFAGPLRAAARSVDAFIAMIGSAPAATFIREETYLNAMLLEAGCLAIPLNACHTGPGGQLTRVPSFAKSDFFTRPLRTHAIRVLLSGIEQAASIKGATGGVGSITLEACGGAMNKPGPQATAFVHRDGLFLGQYSTSWTSPGARAEVIRQHAWLRSYYQLLHPHASGQAYQNYPDPDLADWPDAYYGANYPWLTLVKTSYDPANVFQFPQSIVPG